MPYMPVSEAARQLRKEESARAHLYSRLSPIVGAFDASEMSAAEIAATALRRLGLKVPSNDDAKIEAANCWLAGRQRAADMATGKRSATDSAAGSFIDKYIKGGA